MFHSTPTLHAPRGFVSVQPSPEIHIAAEFVSFGNYTTGPGKRGLFQPSIPGFVLEYGNMHQIGEHETSRHFLPLNLD